MKVLSPITACLATLSLSHGAVLYSINSNSLTAPTTATYVASEVTVTTLSGVTGTANTDFTPQATKPRQFHSNDEIGWLTLASGGTVGSEAAYAVNSQETLDGQYFTFTVTADPGNVLNLTSLTFDARRATGTASSTDRDIEIWATTNGAAFTYSAGGFLFQQNDVSALRTDPDGDQFNVNLSAAQYQGVNSITFRVFNPGVPAFHGVDMDNIVLNGAVVPEPSIALLSGFGALALLRRRRA